MADDPDMAELVQMFVADLPQRAAAVEQAWSGRRLDDLRRLAHQLRGSSASYGFEVIGDTAGQIEDQIKAMSAQPPEDLASVRAGVEELLSLCHRAMRGA
jgi:HPt (histidine-containing phosphotransfer) domain-containing protein